MQVMRHQTCAVLPVGSHGILQARISLRQCYGIAHGICERLSTHARALRLVREPRPEVGPHAGNLGRPILVGNDATCVSNSRHSSLPRSTHRMWHASPTRRSRVQAVTTILVDTTHTGVLPHHVVSIRQHRLEEARALGELAGSTLVEDCVHTAVLRPRR